MRAFVKTNNGTFPNVNFFLAWEAFNTMGYSVTCFEEKDIPTLDVTPGTPTFAGVKIFRAIIDKLGVDYPPFDCYPEVLKSFYGRTLYRSTLGIERKKFHEHRVPVFVKPVLPKQFVGHVWNSIINLIPLTNIPDEAEVWVCEPIIVLSEFRVYVHDGEVLGVKHYWGDWSITPQPEFVDEVIRAYKGAPIAYGIDIAVAKKHQPIGHIDIEKDRMDIVMEVNDGCNLGNYGLDSIHYGEMMVARWFEIMGQDHKKAVKDQLIQEIRANQAEEFQHSKVPEMTWETSNQVFGKLKSL